MEKIKSKLIRSLGIAGLSLVTLTTNGTPVHAEEDIGQEEEIKPWTTTARITSYCLRGTTRSGTPVRTGVVATDPNYIPLGSTVDIESLGEGFIAEDTGSAVKGLSIDVWSESCDWARNWGIRNRAIRITIPDNP